MNSLSHRLRPVLPCALLAGACAALCLLLLVRAAGAADGAGPLLKLLQSGRVPAERLPNVVELVCKRGNAADLEYVFSQLLSRDAWAPDLRRSAIGWLAEAATINKVRPEGDLARVERLLDDPQAQSDANFALAAIRLASVWQAPKLAGRLQAMLTAPGASEKIQAAAIEGLSALGNADSRQALAEAAAAGALKTRFLAIAALAQRDLPAATKSAVAALSTATPQDDSAGLIQAFLDRKQGSQALAAELGTAKLAPDVAKRALRAMYAAGRSDAELSAALSQAAGVALDAPPPTGEALNRIVADVTAKGDPIRGERIFRRAELSCLKCHTVAGAGGNVGPDLSPVGGTSPVDYVVNSILNPNLAIKEQFVTKNILTVNGLTVTGIVVDRNDQEIKLKDATGKLITVATADIDEEVDGKSLMPQGLTKFLTEEELLDLARFISELGKPGPYAVRPRSTIQRWRLLAQPNPQLVAETPNIEFLRQWVFAAPDEEWLPAFSTVAGVLPLDETRSASRQTVLYLQGQIEVAEPGPVTLAVDGPEAVAGWLDSTPFDPQQKQTSDLPQGPHTLTLRVVLGAREQPTLKAEFSLPPDSGARFTVR